MKTSRLALIYCDGSAGIMTERETLEGALRQARESDFNETDPARLTKVATVTLDIVEFHAQPDAGRADSCPTCGAHRKAQAQ